MTDARRDADATPLDPPDVPLEEFGRQSAGEQPAGDQEAYVRQGEVDDLGAMTDTEIYQGELEAGVNDDLPTESTAANLEDLTSLELRSGETGDPNVAAEEGLSWIPPIDPPVVPDLDDPQGLQVAAGFGTSALDEPYDADHHSDTLADDDEMATRIREALRADSTTSRYADRIAIATRDGTIVLRGIVDDISDTDDVIEVAGRASGVVEVIDELEVAGI